MSVLQFLLAMSSAADDVISRTRWALRSADSPGKKQLLIRISALQFTFLFKRQVYTVFSKCDVFSLSHCILYVVYVALFCRVMIDLVSF